MNYLPNFFGLTLRVGVLGRLLPCPYEDGPGRISTEYGVHGRTLCLDSTPHGRYGAVQRGGTIILRCLRGLLGGLYSVSLSRVRATMFVRSCFSVLMRLYPIELALGIAGYGRHVLCRTSVIRNSTMGDVTRFLFIVLEGPSRRTRVGPSGFTVPCLCVAQVQIHVRRTVLCRLPSVIIGRLTTCLLGIVTVLWGPLLIVSVGTLCVLRSGCV